MSYKLVYTRRAIKDIRKLDKNVKKRLGESLLRYLEDPLSYAGRLTDSNIGMYRFRVGDYRVIFDLEGSEIVVLRVGHRSEIYR